VCDLRLLVAVRLRKGPLFFTQLIAKASRFCENSCVFADGLLRFYKDHYVSSVIASSR
jgi:hypothetical protein